MRVVYFLLGTFWFLGCQQKETEEKYSEGIYLGIEPDSRPQLLAPNLVNTNLDEYNGTFSPEGNEFYYTKELNDVGYIYYTKMNYNGHWSIPEIAPFSGKFSDYDPLFSPDGSRLYFSSLRPNSDGLGSTIWFAERSNENKWSNPKQLNFTAKDEYYSSLTTDGKIYFNIWSTLNIYKAIPFANFYKVLELDTTINGKYEKGDPFISPQEDYMIFRAIREDGLGRGDLYISFNSNNSWTKPMNLGSPINSDGQEMCPFVSSDGKVFVFSSSRTKSSMDSSLNPQSKKSDKKLGEILNGRMNIYYMSTEFIEEFRSISKE